MAFKVCKSFPGLINSDDDSDMSDNENRHSNKEPQASMAQDNCDIQGQNDLIKDVKPSQKLEIVEKRNNLKKKFSIWSEILLEEELSKTMDKSMKIKKRKSKKNKGKEKDSDNYSFWTNKDFERKFSVKKSTDLKKKIKAKELVKDVPHEIAAKLKESRVDIISRVVEVIGEEKTRKLTAEVLDIESAGGMMVANGLRKRSPGGILFFLVKNEPGITDQEKLNIFGDDTVKVKNKEIKKLRTIKAKTKTTQNHKNKNKKPKKKKKKQRK